MPARGTLAFGKNHTPESVRHYTLGHVWLVLDVLERWKTPADASDRLRTGGVVESWRLRVSGPLPGQPGRRGHFVMTVRTYGNRPGWWLSPEG